MIYVLEMRSTANWDDVRYRAYTTSKRRADTFKAKVPKIKFTDSGHGIIAVVSEKPPGQRLRTISILADHVREALARQEET